MLCKDYSSNLVYAVSQSFSLNGTESTLTFSGLAPDTFYRIHVTGLLRERMSPKGTTTSFTGKPFFFENLSI